MKRLVSVTVVAAAAAVAVACGSNGTPTHTDGPLVDTPKQDAAVDAPAGPQLKVKNYLSWCAVTVGSGSASAAAVQTVPITASGQVTLTATRASAAFEVSGNMWHHTDGDTGTGETGTITGTGATTLSTATVTVASGTSKCVWVCCPFSATHDGCAVPEQCP